MRREAAVLAGIVFATAAPAQHAAQAPTGRIEGVVVDMLGEPVRAAEVWVAPWDDPDCGRATALRVVFDPPPAKK